MRFLFPNYANSEEDWQTKFDSAGFPLNIIMRTAAGKLIEEPTKEEATVGKFPQTVGIKLKNDLEQVGVISWFETY